MPIDEETKRELIKLVDHAIQEVGPALVGTFSEYIRQSKSSFLNAYGSSILMADLMHKNKLITDRAYEAIMQLTTIIGGATALANIRNLIWGSEVGASIMVPKATTVLETAIETGGKIAVAGIKAIPET